MTTLTLLLDKRHFWGVKTGSELKTWVLEELEPWLSHISGVGFIDYYFYKQTDTNPNKYSYNKFSPPS